MEKYKFYDWNMNYHTESDLNERKFVKAKKKTINPLSFNFNRFIVTKFQVFHDQSKKIW